MQSEQKEVNKYIDGKIYKLVHSNSELIYIGSTTKTLMSRFASHKILSNSTTSRKLFEIDGNVKIELIEAYPCSSKNELWNREKHYIELNKNVAVNIGIPLRTKKESSAENYKKNIETNREKRKQYYESHKKQMIDQHKEYKEANKDKLKQYFKDRYQKNKDERKISDAARRNTPEHKAYMKEYNKQYWEKSKIKIVSE
jgi:flagellar biosynthesis GTPase FlhF